MSTKNFILLCTATAAVLALGVHFGAEWLFEQAGAEPYVYTGLAIVALSTIGSWLFVVNGIKNRINLFTTYVMGGMLIRMFVGLAAMTLVALKFKTYATTFVLSYFFFYFIFTAFEVVALMRNLRAEKSDKRDEN